MKVLWITNRPVADTERKYDVGATSGTWMEPALTALRGKEDVEIAIATVAPIKKPDFFKVGGIKYYCLPKGKKLIYDHNNRINRKEWADVIKDFSPDLIMVWGTEYAHGYCALKEAGTIPSLIYTQGILDSVERYYLGGMTFAERFRSITLRSLIKRDSVGMQQKRFGKKANTEKKMLEVSSGVIVESRWAELWCRRICENCRIYYSEISLGQIFYDMEWKYESCNKHTVFCSAPSGYPLKGLHQMIRAMSLLVKKYPDVELHVPGMADPFNCGLASRLKRQDYMKFLMHLIDTYGLRDRIKFLGGLLADEMAEEMRKANVFVVPSAIENLSTTLREAMLVGTPSVASFVGGIPEIVNDGENGFLYRFEDYESLADRIACLFDDAELCRKMSENARHDMRILHNPENKREILYNIYKDILS